MSFIPVEFTPWTDRAGRFSPLRAVVFAGVLAPALWLAALGLQGQLGARPVTAAIHDSGDWAVRFLLLALLISPLRAATRRNELIGVRRMLGLAALAYALLHLLLYIVDQKWDLWKVGSEIALRTYLTVGFVGVLGLLALGATSTDGMVRRLGAEAWSRLHMLTYPLAIIALVHFYWQRKLEIYEPTLMAGFLLWLFGWRVLRRYGLTASLSAMFALALAAGLCTMLLEAGYLALRHGLPFMRILNANLDFEYVIRPGWWVLAAGFAMVGLATAFGMAKPPRGRSAGVRASAEA
jgi:methionine sulfoxide reductase heme-binding subunit